MSITTIFDEEDAMISKANNILEEGRHDANPLLPHFSTLVSAYTKLNKQQKRIIRLSDKQHNKLSVLNSEMKHILDNVPVGIMLINAQGLIQPSFSQFVYALFSHTRKIGGAPLEKILYWEDDREKERQSLRKWLGLVFDLAFDWDLVGGLGPDQIEHESNSGRLYYRHSFHRVIHDNGDLYLLITTMDVSERMRQKIALAEQETAHNFEMETLACVVNTKNPAELIDVMNETERMLNSSQALFEDLFTAEDKTPIYHHLFRLMHSIKGQARSYGMNEFGRLAHLAEDILAQYRANEITFETGVIEGVLASDQLLAIIQKMKDLLKSSDALIEKVFNRNREHAAAIRNRRRGIRVDEDSLAAIVQQAEILKQMASDQAQLTEAIDSLNDQLFKLTLQHLDVAFNRFHNIVADVSRSLGKQAELVTDGDRIHLDPETHHQIISSLIHLLRNALDHGIEPPELREKRGKDPMGRIHLTTVEGPDTLVITLCDDGAGIDPQAVAETAVRKGLASEDLVMGMNDQQKIELILLPGFSVRDSVTDLSGRGVGMDVVAEAMKEMNGTLTLRSEKDKGSTIQMVFPIVRRPRPAACREVASIS